MLEQWYIHKCLVRSCQRVDKSHWDCILARPWSIQRVTKLLEKPSVLTPWWFLGNWKPYAWWYKIWENNKNRKSDNNRKWGLRDFHESQKNRIIELTRNLQSEGLFYLVASVASVAWPLWPQPKLFIYLKNKVSLRENQFYLLHHCMNHTIAWHRCPAAYASIPVLGTSPSFQEFYYVCCYARTLLCSRH